MTAGTLWALLWVKLTHEPTEFQSQLFIWEIVGESKMNEKSVDSTG